MLIYVINKTFYNSGRWNVYMELKYRDFHTNQEKSVVYFNIYININLIYFLFTYIYFIYIYL